MPAFLLAAIILGSSAATDTTFLYRMTLLRAAPGELLPLIDLHRQRRSVHLAGGDGPVFLMRHSQGDQWDLLVLAPMGSFAEHYAPTRAGRRDSASARADVPADAWAREVDRRTARREDLFVWGPPLSTIAPALGAAGYFHVEMFVALAGRREELRRQRLMENAFLAALDRPQNLIFTREAGAAWDVVTIGLYRDLRHFAESEGIPAEQEEAAARAAGFAGADRIGPYLRTLILEHHDTLARAVR